MVVRYHSGMHASFFNIHARAAAPNQLGKNSCLTDKPSYACLAGKIYICGGFNGQECLNNAECYDPSTNQWTMIAPMRNRRSGVGVIAYRDHIYALGGFNGITRMNTGEKYNPASNTWQTIPEMYNPRSNFAIEVYWRPLATSSFLILVYLFYLSHDPPHDKSNKMICAPSEDPVQPGHPPSLPCLHDDTLDP